MFCNGSNKAIFDRRGSRRDTEIGVPKRCRNGLKHWCPGCISPDYPSDMPFVRHGYEMEYLRSSGQSTSRVADFRRMSVFEFVRFKRPYDCRFLVYYAPDW